MSKKKIVTCISLLAVCVATSLYGGLALLKEEVNAATNENVTLSAELKETYVRKEKFTVPSANISVNGSEQMMSHVLVFPDGDTSTAKEVFLTDLGEYTLQYTYEGNVAEYTFDVENGMSSLFSATSNVIIENDVKTPDYFQPSDEDGYGASADRGIKFTIENGTSASIYYNNIIDLEALGFSKYADVRTMEGSFLEWLATPTDPASKEFSRMEVVLTDVYDANNFITIEMVAGDIQATYPQDMFVRSSACGRYKPLGWLIGTEALLEAGTAIKTSVYGVVNGYAHRTGRLYFDNSNLELWGGATEYGSVAGTFRNLRIMDGYNNPEVVGLKNVWNGFTTGEVYLQINVDNIHLSNASFMVMNIGGNDVTKDYTATDNLIIDVDYGSIGKNQSIVAGENLSCPVFGAKVYSNTAGIVDGLTTKVFFGDDKAVSIPIINGRFAVENAGTYYIEYIHNSSFGYAYECVAVHAKSAYDERNELNYIPNNEIPNSAIVGDLIYLFDGEIKGGVGVTKCDYLVTHSNGANAENVEILKSGKTPYFKIEKNGTYTVTFIVTDELNYKLEKTLEIIVADNEVFNIKLPNFPTAFLIGNSYQLPKATAIFFDENGIRDAKVSTLVNGTDYTNQKYTVSGDFTITYKAELKENSAVFATKEVDCKAVKQKIGTYYLTSYFASENGEVSIDKTSLIISEPTGDSKLSFLNKLSETLINLKFSPYYDEDKVYSDNNYTGITVWLTDSMDATQKVKLSVRQDLINNKLYSSLYINDEFSSFITGSFDGSNRNAFALNYDYKTHTLRDILNTDLGEIKAFVNGNAFNGFSSGYVYMDMELENVTAQSKYRILSIGNQKFSSLITSDNAAPEIIYSEKLASYNTTKLNENFIVPSAVAYDCLSDVEYIKVIVSDPTGRAIYDGDISQSQSIVFDKKGKYEVVYEAKDINGKKTSVKHAVFTQEHTPPTIAFAGDYKTHCKLYAEYTIAKVTVSDDSSVQTLTYAISPDYEQILITNDTIVFDKKGTYKICYYAFDEFYNYTIMSYTVEVNE